MSRYFLNKKNWIRSVSLLIGIIYIAFLYIDFRYKDLGNTYSLHLKYLSIVLCFIISMLIGKDGYNRTDKILVQLARFFTLLADYFMVILYDNKLGILFFCMVQLTYIIRHTIAKRKKRVNLIVVVITLITAIILFLNINIAFVDRDFITVGLLYASLLISSLYCGFSTLKGSMYTKAGAWIISIGIFLFFMCDLNVGLFNIVGNIDLSTLPIKNPEFFTGYLMWLFYLPSQLLLALSGFKIEYIRKVFYK